MCSKARKGYNYAAKNIYAYADSSAKNYEVCDKMAVDLLRNAIRVSFLQIFALSLLNLVPFYKTIFTDEKEMIIPIILPFIDPDTQNGFYLNFVYQISTDCFGVLIVVGCELVSCFVANNVKVTAHVTRNSLSEFDDLIKKDKRFTKKHSIRFRNILLQMLDFQRFANFHSKKKKIYFQFLIKNFNFNS